MLIKRGTTWHSKIMFEGKVHWKTLKTSNYDQAVKHESLIRSELLKGEFGILDVKRTPSLAALAPRLQAHWEANCAPRTARFYRDCMATLVVVPFLSQCKLHKLDESIIDRYIQQRMKDKVRSGKIISVTTVNHSLRTLNRALHLAVEWKLIGHVPKIRQLTGEHQREFVISETVQADMVKLARKEWPTSVFQFLLPFLCDTGLRISEATGLLRDHVEFDPDGLPVAIRVVKGKSKYAVRRIPLTQRAALNLAAAIRQSKCDYCWTGTKGESQLHRRWPSRQFLQLRNELSLGDDAVLHSTRHTFCSRLGDKGAPAFTIQKLAGHSSVLISQKYVHSDAEATLSAISLLEV